MVKYESKAGGGDELERLTRFIRDTFQKIEKTGIGRLSYGGVPLRGALERMLYQEIVLDQARLEALSGLDKSKPTLPMLCPSLRPPSLLRDTAEMCRAWARLFYHRFWRTARRYSDHDSARTVEFVFCIIDPRFIDFFLPMIENLGRDRCALLSLSNGDVALEAKRHGLQLCPTRYSRVQLGALGRPPAALYPRYAIAVDQYLKALGTLEWMRPRTVIFGEAASFEEEIVAQAARSLRMRTVRVQHGRAGVIHPGYYDMPYDLMLMWGQGFVDRLKPTSPDCRYEITGSPLIDQRAANALDPHLAAFMESKPTVTVISQPQSTNILRSDYEALVSVVDGVMRSATGLNVLVRLHPADKAQDFAQLAQTCPQRMRVTRSQDFPLNAILRYSSVVVGLYSTALTEAVAVGVVPVVLRLGERHRIFPSPEDSGAAELATSPEAAVAAICRLATDPTAKAGYGSRMETFVRHYFGPAGGSAVARIVARIENANTGGGARQ